MFLLTLLVAGNETTRTLLSGTALVLDEHPDQRALVGRATGSVAGRGGGVPALGHAGTGVLPHGDRGRGGGGHAGASGRLPVHALRVREPRRAGLRGRCGAVRRAAADQPDARGLRLRRARVPGGQPGPAGGADLRGGAAGAIPRLRGGRPGRSGWPRPPWPGSRSLPVVLAPCAAAAPVGCAGSTASRSSPSNNSTASGSALSRSRPPVRSERTNPLSRSTLTCMLTVGWASRKSVASSPTVLGAVARECRMRQAGGVGHRLEAPGHGLGAGPGASSPGPTPIPMTTRPGTSRYRLEPKNRQGTNSPPACRPRCPHTISGRRSSEDVTPRRYQ